MHRSGWRMICLALMSLTSSSGRGDISGGGMSSVALPAEHVPPARLYHDPRHESPVRGDPGDLVLIPGDGFSAGSVVVYSQIGSVATHPSAIPPPPLTAQIGQLVPLRIDANAVTVRLPMMMTAGQPYALWVVNHDAYGDHWSNGVLINDARPRWISGPRTAVAASPDGAYPYISQTADRPGIGREVKIVGRNLQPAPGKQTLVKFANALNTYQLPAAALDAATARYVAQVTIPVSPQWAVGKYDVAVSRDGGASWVSLDDALRVLNDPVAKDQITVGAPGSASDDTFVISRALHEAATRPGGADVVFPPGMTWTLNLCGNAVDANGQNPLLDPGDKNYESCWAMGGIVVPAGVNLVAGPGPGARPVCCAPTAAPATRRSDGGRLLACA